jgi:hypothetical protein
MTSRMGILILLWNWMTLHNNHRAYEAVMYIAMSDFRMEMETFRPIYIVLGVQWRSHLAALAEALGTKMSTWIVIDEVMVLKLYNELKRYPLNHTFLLLRSLIVRITAVGRNWAPVTPDFVQNWNPGTGNTPSSFRCFTFRYMNHRQFTPPLGQLQIKWSGTNQLPPLTWIQGSGMLIGVHRVQTFKRRAKDGADFPHH